MKVPLRKHATRQEIDRELEFAAASYRASLRALGAPQNVRWIAAVLRGQIKAAPQAERPQLYWPLAIVLWTARQQGLARKAARVYRGLMPATELDKVLDDAKARLGIAIRGILPPGHGKPGKRQR